LVATIAFALLHVCVREKTSNMVMIWFAWSPANAMPGFEKAYCWLLTDNTACLPLES